MTVHLKGDWSSNQETICIWELSIMLYIRYQSGQISGEQTTLYCRFLLTETMKATQPPDNFC